VIEEVLKNLMVKDKLLINRNRFTLIGLRRKRMKKNIYVLGLFSLLILVLAACTPITGVVAIATTPPNATPQQLPTQESIREAQITNVDVQLMQSSPVQVNAIVNGNLTESCATLIEPQVSYASNTFQIKILVSSPTDRGCLQVTTPFEKTVPLDTGGLTPGTYKVIANGAIADFTLPSEPSQVVNNLQLVIYDSHHNIQVVNPSFPADIILNPSFIGLIPSAGSANGVAYVLDDTNGIKAVAIDENGRHDLSFIERPTIGLAVFPGSADSQPRLAWGTEYTQAYPNSTLQVSAPDGSGFETLLTQEVSEPLLQLVAEFWSADGKSLYFSKEPVGIGGYILFGGASNLYRIDVITKEVSEVLSLASSDQPQVCLDSISSDYRYIADHCSQNFIRIRDLRSGGTGNILPPDEGTSGYQLAGSARFSPDGSHIAFSVAKGMQSNEQGWVVVSDTAISNSKIILASSVGSYYTVAGWLNDQTLLVQSTSLNNCSPYCAAELWVVGIDGSNPQKVADGSFITILLNGNVASQPPYIAGCQDTAEYVNDDGKDGTTYAPNTAFMKTWTLKNIGTCNWDSSYLVYQVSGAFMTQQLGYWLVPQGSIVQPGQTVDVVVGMTSPPAKGHYTSYWGLKNAEGEIIPVKGGADANSFYADINVKSGSTGTGAVTATSIDIEPEQGSGDPCIASTTYFVHAHISTDGSTSVSYEIGSSAGQISAGYFEVNGDQVPYVRGTLEFDGAEEKTVNLRFVGPYPYPDDISVMLRVKDREWVTTKLNCP
jgi:Ig-like domain from next to BRCA1 gene/WD40-like Beta Propeller Repeat